MRPKPKAFTLVELLVVIGIIALLISILLPALSRARQQANLVDCMSRLHQIGNVLGVYEADNQGRIPLAQVFRYLDPVHPPDINNEENNWYWVFTLGDLMNRSMLSTSDGLVHNLSKVFTDTDTNTDNNFRWVSHYTCNPRLFYSPDMYNFTAPDSESPTGLDYEDTFKINIGQNRKVASVSQPANVFAIWDGPQAADQNYNTFPCAEALDNWAFYQNGLCYNVGSLNAGSAIWPIAGGSPGVGDGSAQQKQYNYDVSMAFGSGTPPWLSLRFRHSNNTKLAALCLDGHVTSRLIGGVLRTDMYSNVPTTTW